MRIRLGILGLGLLLTLPAPSMAADETPSPSPTPTAKSITVDVDQLLDTLLAHVECGENLKNFKKAIQKRTQRVLDPLRDLARLRLIETTVLHDLNDALAARIAECKAAHPAPTPTPTATPTATPGSDNHNSTEHPGGNDHHEPGGDHH